MTEKIASHGHAHFWSPQKQLMASFVIVFICISAHPHIRTLHPHICVAHQNKGVPRADRRAVGCFARLHKIASRQFLLTRRNCHCCCYCRPKSGRYPRRPLTRPAVPIKQCSPYFSNRHHYSSNSTSFVKFVAI